MRCIFDLSNQRASECAHRVACKCRIQATDCNYETRKRASERRGSRGNLICESLTTMREKWEMRMDAFAALRLVAVTCLVCDWYFGNDLKIESERASLHSHKHRVRARERWNERTKERRNEQEFLLNRFHLWAFRSSSKHLYKYLYIIQIHINNINVVRRLVSFFCLYIIVGTKRLVKFFFTSPPAEQ